MDARITEFAVADAKARFSELISRAEAGEEITIRRHGTPVARLVPAVATLSVDERRRRRLAFENWRERQGPTLEGTTTVRELIDTGRG